MATIVELAATAMAGKLDGRLQHRRHEAWRRPDEAPSSNRALARGMTDCVPWRSAGTMANAIADAEPP